MSMRHCQDASEVRLARTYLSAVAEPPAPALGAFVARHGPVRAAELVRAGEVPEIVEKETIARRDRDRVVAHLSAAAAVGARLVTPEDPEWPAAQCLAFELAGHKHLPAPIALWVRGEARLDEMVERSVAIVGSRAATGYGGRVAHTLALGVAGAGFTVVSGAAFGIDAAAHRGALATDGRTVAVLACGIERAYPMAHDRLLRHIARTGLVVSEYPPGTVPARHRFLVRNRIIAGLAGGTVVVEAGWRSGSRRTASDAGLLGRPLMAVPGPVTSAMSVGCHRLLREPGTVAVTRPEEVIEAVGRIGVDLAPGFAEGGGPRRITDGLSDAGQRVHESLSWSAASDPDQVSMESGLPIELVRVALPELARNGLAERTGNGWRRCPRLG